MAWANERAEYLLTSDLESLANSFTINPTFRKSKALILSSIRFCKVSILKFIHSSSFKWSSRKSNPFYCPKSSMLSGK